MFSSTLKRSVASLGVVAGLLAAAGPASAGPAPSDAQDTQASRKATGVVVLIGANDYGVAEPQGLIMRDGGICNPRNGPGC